MRSAEHALRDLPETALSLGRRLESELRFRARAEVLQAIAALSHIDDPRITGAIRRAFGIHVAVVEALREFWGARPLRQALPGDGSNPLAELFDERARAEAELFAVAETVDSDVRGAIDRARGVLIPEVGPLQAAIVLMPQIKRVVAAVVEDTLGNALAGVTPDECAVVLGAEQPGIEPDRRPDRTLVDAILLRVLMRRHLVEWSQSEGTDREDALRRLGDDKLAYRHVAQRLQARCGAFMEEGRRDVAVLGGKIRKTLFSVYLEATRVLNGVESVADEVSDDTASITQDLSDRIDEADRAAAAVRAEQQANREVVEQALDGVDRPDRETPPEPVAVKDLRAERRRRNVLIGVAGVLAVITVVVNVVLWSGSSSSSPTAPFAPLEQATPGSKVVPAGDVVYVELSGWVWDSMGEPERVKRVEQAVGLARQGGASVLYVVDETRRELARWSPSSGVELLGS